MMTLAPFRTAQGQRKIVEEQRRTIVKLAHNALVSI